MNCHPLAAGRRKEESSWGGAEGQLGFLHTDSIAILFRVAALDDALLLVLEFLRSGQRGIARAIASITPAPWVAGWGWARAFSTAHHAVNFVTPGPL